MSYRTRQVKAEPLRRREERARGPPATARRPAARRRRRRDEGDEGDEGGERRREVERRTQWTLDMRAAVASKNWEAVVCLAGFPWAPDGAATRALCAACRGGAGAGVLRALQLRGAEPDSRNDGELCLVEGARAGDAAAVAWLIAQGVDLDARDRFANSALAAAATRRHGHIVEILLEAGADFVGEGNHAGWTVTAIAAGASWFGRQHARSTVARCTGADLRARAAADAGADSAVRALLAAGADPGTRDRSGRTPAERARERGHAELAAWIEQQVEARASGIGGAARA